MAVDPNLLQGEFNDGSDDCAPEVEQLLAGFLRALIDEHAAENRAATSNPAAERNS